MAKKKIVKKKSAVKTPAAKSTRSGSKTVAKKKTAVKAKPAAKKKAVAKPAKSKPVSKPAKSKLVSKPAKSKPVSKSIKTKPAPKKKVVAKVKAKPVVKKEVAEKTGKAKSAPVVMDEGRILAESVIAGMLEKKAQHIRLLDLRKIENAVCDYFIICEGTSNTQVESIADSVETTVKMQVSQRPFRSEGWDNALWILIDYVNVVVHVFERDTRQFYNLESLWADAEEIPVKQ